MKPNLKKWGEREREKQKGRERKRDNLAVAVEGLLKVRTPVLASIQRNISARACDEPEQQDEGE